MDANGRLLPLQVRFWLAVVIELVETTTLS